MHLIGCLILLVFLFGGVIIALLGKSVEMLGATAVYIWESFLNLFRSVKKETRNPWTGQTNFEKEDQARAEKREREEQKYHQNEDGTKPKLYDKEDGEYIDFTEVK